MHGLFQDLKHSVRILAKKPGFTLIAVVTLALGIGANTAIFGVVNAVLLRPLQYPNPDRLVAISENSLWDPDISVAYPDYLDWLAQQSVFEEMSAHMPTGGIISGANEPERVLGRWVTPSFFSTLGVQPMLGRAFTEAENNPGAPPVMVISHGLWQRQFGGAHDAIGKPIAYNGEPWTVIGVMPPWFDFYGRTNLNNDLFTPLGRRSNQAYMQDRNSHTVQVTARLKPGVPIEQARAERDRHPYGAGGPEERCAGVSHKKWSDTHANRRGLWARAGVSADATDDHAVVRSCAQRCHYVRGGIRFPDFHRAGGLLPPSTQSNQGRSTGCDSI